MTEDPKVTAARAVIKAAKRWAAQRTKSRRAAHLGKARSWTALKDRADELHEAVKSLNIAQGET